jgi:hypothetical protein
MSTGIHPLLTAVVPEVTAAFACLLFLPVEHESKRLA